MIIEQKHNTNFSSLVKTIAQSLIIAVGFLVIVFIALLFIPGASGGYLAIWWFIVGYPILFVVVFQIVYWSNQKQSKEQNVNKS